MRCSKHPDGAIPTRKYAIGNTVTAGQVVCVTATGVAGNPASVNDYTEAIGVSLEAATYSTTQNAAYVNAEMSWHPMTLYRGQVSGGAAASTAFAETTDGNLLTNTSASSGGTVITDGDVGTSEFVGGYAVGLTGANAGQVRRITAHSDNTSTTVTEPFNSAIAVGDTFLRTFAPGLQGLELTTNFQQFNGTPGAGVDLPDTGHAGTHAILIDGQRVDQGLKCTVLNATNPVVEVEFILIDHYLNSVA